MTKTLWLDDGDVCALEVGSTAFCDPQMHGMEMEMEGFDFKNSRYTPFSCCYYSTAFYVQLLTVVVMEAFFHYHFYHFLLLFHGIHPIHGSQCNALRIATRKTVGGSLPDSVITQRAVRYSSCRYGRLPLIG